MQMEKRIFLSVPLQVMIVGGYVASVLTPMHRLPIPSFMHEWLLAAVLLITAAYGTRRAQTVTVHLDHVICGLAVLVVAASGQVLVGVAQIPAFLMFLGYVCLAFVAYQVGFSTGISKQKEELITAFAWAICMAALMSCLCGAFQLSRWEVPFELVSPPGNHIYGNLAQTNHFNDLLWLGVVSVLYLIATSRISAKLAWFTILIFLVFSVLSASRSGYLYAGAVTVVVLLCKRSFTSGDQIRARLVLPIFPLYAILYVAISHSGLFEYFGFENISTRMHELAGSEGSTGAGGRFGLWRNLFGILNAFGYGVGNFRELMREHPESWLHTGFAGVPEHAHNLLFDIGIEFGWVILVITGAMALHWLISCFKQRGGYAEVWAFGVLGIIGIHALLEYPLNYVLFLVPFFVALGVLSATVSKGHNFYLRLPYVQLGLLSGLFMLGLAYRHFQPIDEVFFDLQMGIKYGEHSRSNVLVMLDEVPAYSPFRPYASLVKAMMVTPQDIQAGMIEKDCDNTVRVWLSPASLANCAANYQLQGMETKASSLLSSVCSMIPIDGDRAWNHFVTASGGKVSIARPLACTQNRGQKK